MVQMVTIKPGYKNTVSVWKNALLSKATTGIVSKGVPRFSGEQAADQTPDQVSIFSVYPIRKRSLISRWFYPSDSESFLEMFPTATEISQRMPQCTPLSREGSNISLPGVIPDRESMADLISRKGKGGVKAFGFTTVLSNILENYSVHSVEDIRLIYSLAQQMETPRLKALDAVSKRYVKVGYYPSYRAAFLDVAGLLEASPDSKQELLEFPRHLDSIRGRLIELSQFDQVFREATLRYLKGATPSDKASDMSATEPYTDLSYSAYMQSMFHHLSDLGLLLLDSSLITSMSPSSERKVPAKLLMHLSARSDNYRELGQALNQIKSLLQMPKALRRLGLQERELFSFFLQVNNLKAIELIGNLCKEPGGVQNMTGVFDFLKLMDRSWNASPRAFSNFLDRLQNLKDKHGLGDLHVLFGNGFKRFGPFPVENTSKVAMQVLQLYDSLSGLSGERKQKYLGSLFALFENWSEFNEFFELLSGELQGNENIVKIAYRAFLISGNSLDEAVKVCNYLKPFESLNLSKDDWKRLTEFALTTLQEGPQQAFQKIWETLYRDISKHKDFALVDTFALMKPVFAFSKSIPNKIALVLKIPQAQRHAVVRQMLDSKFFGNGYLLVNQEKSLTSINGSNLKPLWQVCMRDVHISKSARVFDLVRELEPKFTNPASMAKLLKMVLELPKKHQGVVVSTFVKHADSLSRRILKTPDIDQLIDSGEFQEIWNWWKSMILKTDQSNGLEVFSTLLPHFESLTDLRTMTNNILEFPIVHRPKILDIMNRKLLELMRSQTPKTKVSDNIAETMSVLQGLKAELEKNTNSEYLNIFEKLSLELSDMSLARDLTPAFLQLSHKERDASFLLINSYVKNLNKRDHKTDLHFLALVSSPAQLLNYYMMNRDKISPEAVNALYYAIEYTLPVNQSKKILPELLAMVQPFWETLKQNPRRNNYMHQVSGGITRLYDLINTTRQIQPIVLQNWAKMGTLGLSFSKWQFDTMHRWKGMGPMAKPSLFDVSKLFRRTFARENDTRYHGGFSLYNNTTKLSIELRRAYLVIAKPGLGSLVIRNSSHFFGRDLLQEPAYYFPDKVFSKGKNLFTPERDLNGKEEKFNALGRIINSPQTQQANHEKIQKLLEEFEQAMEPYVAWKCGFKDGKPPEGFKEFLQTALMSVKGGGAMSPYGKHKNLRLVWVDRYGLPFVAKAFDLSKPDNLAELEFYLDVLNRKTAVSSQDEYNAKVPNLLKFIAEGMQKGYELVLKSE